MDFFHWHVTRRCPDCRSLDVRRSERKGLMERIVLRLLVFRPFRCQRCSRRYYGFSFSKKIAGRPPAHQDALRDGSLPPAERGRAGVSRPGDDAGISPVERIADWIHAKGPEGSRLSKLVLGFKHIEKNQRNRCILALIDAGTVSCFIRSAPGGTEDVVVHADYLEAHSVQFPQDRKASWDQRRTRRMRVDVPVTVFGHATDEAPFQEETTAHEVNAHGGLITLAASVRRGQQLALTNVATQEAQPCRVVRLGNPQNDKTEVGIEFVHPARKFWNLPSPPADRKRVQP